MEGLGSAPLLSFHRATESVDHKPQLGTLSPQTFCSVFPAEMTARLGDPGPGFHKRCQAYGLPRKVSFLGSGLIYTEAVKKNPDNK